MFRWIDVTDWLIVAIKLKLDGHRIAILLENISHFPEYVIEPDERGKDLGFRGVWSWELQITDIISAEIKPISVKVAAGRGEEQMGGRG